MRCACTFSNATILLVEEESELVDVIAAASKAGYNLLKERWLANLRSAKSADIGDSFMCR